MKKIFTIICCAAVTQLHAQGIKLETGKKITTTTVSAINMDLGMAGGEMKMNTTSVSIVDITGTDNDHYKGMSTITKMTMSEEGAGGNVNFDSDKKEDMNSEIGKQLGDAINVPSDILIDKKNGHVKSSSPEKTPEDDNPFSDLMGGAPSGANAASPTFFVVPSDKKVGDKWSETVTKDNLKIVSNYELQSIADGIATVLVDAKTTGSLTKEANGTQVEVTINSAAKSTINTTVVSGVVKKNVTTTTMDGTLGVMGQSLPISMNGTTTTTTAE